MKLLVCGGAGFIGSNFIRYMLSEHKDVEIINYDILTYAGNLNNIADVSKDRRYRFVHADISDADLLNSASKGADCLVNFAAETHVDRSVHLSSRPFVMTNIVGVHNILEIVKKNKIPRFVQISTDEVYGSLEMGSDEKFTEESTISPNSPYSAAKASGDILCRSYFKTYGVPVIVTRCSNNYGPYQHPEKLIPFFTLRAMDAKPLTIYGDGKNIRDWIHVNDHCSAIDAVIQRGSVGEIYNIGADNERSNIEITKLILEILGKPESLIEFVKDRPGHDRRYAIDSSKIFNELGWKPEHKSGGFKEHLKEIIEWYVNNNAWVEDIKKRAEIDPLHNWS